MKKILIIDDEEGARESLKAIFKFDYEVHIANSGKKGLRILAKEDIKTILWATGYSADYSWLDIPLFDRKGKIRHEGGVVVDSPGMYLMGLSLLRRRKSSFIHGAEADARELSVHLQSYLNNKIEIAEV